VGGSSGIITSNSFASRMSAKLQQEMVIAGRPTRAFASRAAVEAFTLAIYYGTQAELSGTGGSQCLAGSGKTVNGSVAGVGTSSSATVSLGPKTASVSGASGSPNFTLTNVPDGALDLVASKSTTAFNGTSISITLDKLIIRRGVNAANNSTMPVLDFGSAEAFDPVQANLSVGNLGADVATASTFYFTASGSSAAGAGVFNGGLPGSGPFKYYGVPSAKQAPGDLHLAQAIAFPSLGNTSTLRIAGLYFKDPTDRTVTMGPVLNAPTVTVTATSPYVRFNATGTLNTEYGQSFAMTYSQANTTLSRFVQITATQSYLGGLAYNFTIPDFSGVAGWDNNWGLKTGISTTWSVVGAAFTGIGFGSGTPVEGSTFTAGARTGSITP
jgi:hypothetical protein